MAKKGSIVFETVFSDELKDVVERRKNQSLPFDAVWRPGKNSDAGSEEVLPSVARGLIGLSLSGGGIRSAAFCLGVLQALEAKWQIIKRLDYLSTVSGGGYLGSSVAVGMSEGEGKFPFPSDLGGEEDPRVGHLRDYSNYLVAGKFRNILEAIGAVFIGLIANAMLVLPCLLMFAALTIALNPTQRSLSEPSVDLGSWNIFGLSGNFVLTVYVALAAAVAAILLIVLWALNDKESAVSRGQRRKWSGALLLLPVFVFSFQAQPVVLDWYWQQTSDGTLGLAWMKSNLTAALGALSAVFAAGGSWISKLVKAGEDGSGRGALIAKVLGKTLYVAAGLIVPVFLWLVYLNLSNWGILDDQGHYSAAPAWLQSLYSQIAETAVAPACCVSLANHGVWISYGLLAILLIPVAFLIPPNAYTLYFLYRDRLAKGFIGAHDGAGAGGASRRKFALSALRHEYCPALLINTALNIQGDRKLNQRRRHADFFTFSRGYCGSTSTGYCKTSQLERLDRELDVATAMAISGAAASANMGNKTKWYLVFSLAILNIRLGYWLPNPMWVQDIFEASFWQRLLLKIPGSFVWFYIEVLGLLKANYARVYLSDGGHIENLGVYELIKRKCKIIIVVDGEADGAMNMSSFVKLQQYIRIDMGVRIEMDWDQIRTATLSYDDRKPQDVVPHCAIGIIHYSGGDEDGCEPEQGILIYVKSSVTGDENDYIRDYRRRHPDFPHQSTGDQFFSEEQFEVYRALGFHAAGGLFNGEGAVQGLRNGNGGFHTFVEDGLRSSLGIDPKINWV